MTHKKKARKVSRGSGQAIDTAERYGANNYSPLPVVIVRGKGEWVWDAEGNKYLDCLSAYSALNQGHCHPKILKALGQQAKKITLTSRAFHNDQMGPFLKELCQLTGFPKALPMNTGVEAVETAVKLARKWAYEVKGVAPNQAEIIVFNGNFHGRTISVISFSTEEPYRKNFGPLTPGFKIARFGDRDSVQKLINANTAGILIEPIQGEAGVVVPPPGFLKFLRDLCKQHNLLFMLDEIQTGLGRTGKLFAYQEELNSPPDMLILGKALGGGVYPISAVVSRADIMDLLKPGDHGSTFGGNPLGCAVARAAMKVITEENLPQKAATLGKKLLQKLQSTPLRKVAELRGRGLLIGIEVARDVGSAYPLCKELLEEGVLVKDTREKIIRVAPPLVMKEKNIQFLYEKLKKVLA